MKTLCKILLKLTLVILISVAKCHNKDWLILTKNEINKLLTPFPQEAKNFIHYINTLGGFTTHVSKIENLEEQSKSWNFPEGVLNKIRSIVWTDSIEYQIFTFEQLYGVSILEESAGIVRKTNGFLNIFFLKSVRRPC